MKILSLLLVIACVLVSCGSNEQQIQPVIKETSNSKAEITVKAPTLTHTFFPSPTDSPTRTPTETSTIIPSYTFTPTEKPIFTISEFTNTSPTKTYLSSRSNGSVSDTSFIRMTSLFSTSSEFAFIASS